MNQVHLFVVLIAALAPAMGFNPNVSRVNGVDRNAVLAEVRKLAINGDHSAGLLDDSEISEEHRKMPLAPPLTFDKYITMQVGEEDLEKRVCVTIQYSGDSGLKPYYLTVVKRIKASHPDVLIERRILPSVLGDGADQSVFEIMVDGKTVVGKQNTSIHRLGGDKNTLPDLTGGMSVFVSMTEIDLAISKARRRRRPSTMYGSKEENAIRLEMLKRNGEQDTASWND